MSKKSKKIGIIYQEKYKKGNEVDVWEIKKMIDDNIDDIIIEMRERTKYSDNTEGIVIELKY